jgi:Domain of unknown function (DUF4394)
VIRLRLALGLATVAALAVAAPARAEPAVALTTGNSLLLFDTSTPETTTAVPVIGLAVNDKLTGIDQRPATLGLYGVTVTNGSANNSIVKVYAIDPASGQATLVGATATPLPGAGDVATGLDFNPTADRIRYVNVNNENARMNPNNGSLAGNDTDITPPTTAIIGEAYDRNFKDSETTTLYAIDRIGSQLGVQGGFNGSGPGGANGGVFAGIGPLGFIVNAFNDGGFDIDRAGTAYAGLTTSVGNVTNLYTINLASGQATIIGPIGSGVQQVRGLAILNPKPADVPPPAISSSPPSDNLNPTGLLAFKPGARISALRRSGISGGFSCSEACTVTAQLVHKGKKLATGSAKLDEAGVGTLKLRATKAGRSYVPGLRPAKATLSATFRDLGGNSSALSRKVALSK